MLRRWLGRWRGQHARSEDDQTHLLCRLRHATLHPGAALWTPGVGGGNLGGGAVAVLDEVGVGGEVVVGFQAGAREPVHPRGVLAVVEARVPVPEHWNLDELSSPYRYRLRGRARVDVAPETTTNKRLPTVVATMGEAEEADGARAPAGLRELLIALAQVDSTWPEHWVEAFEQLPDAPLGQWATTLGWRLSWEERLLLFDAPERIADVLFQSLDALHLGLAPVRRREAVRVQARTVETVVFEERVVDVVADEQGLALFHPSDGGGDREAAARVSGAGGLSAEGCSGNSVVWPAPAGQLVRVRVTMAAPVLPTRGALVGEVHRGVILVRRGRLFLGGAALVHAAGGAENLALAHAQQWLDVPQGAYRVTVTALHEEKRSAIKSKVTDNAVDFEVILNALERGG